MIGNPVTSRAALDVAGAAQLACLLEVSAPKPGNVSPGRDFEDASYEDFLASAVAIGAPLAGAAARPLGETIRLSVEATARWTRSNTNLGIVLLFAPLARAAIDLASDQGPDLGVLQAAVRNVLAGSTVEDAREVYRAIRIAAPGGLGRSAEQDVGSDPTATLLDVMRLAASRDGIAREYASGFETTFDAGVPALDRARRAGLPWSDAIAETFLTLLAASPDTHIARRAGAGPAGEVSRVARAALDAGGVRSEDGRRALEELDRRLRGRGNLGNPGTTADLTAAAIFVLLLAGGWRRSLRK